MKDFLAKSEPVRVYVLGLLAPAIGVMVIFGWVDSNEAMLWIALGTALLGVAGSQLARSAVIPVQKVQETGQIVTDVSTQVRSAIETTVRDIVGNLMPRTKVSNPVPPTVQENWAQPAQQKNPYA